MKSVTRRVIAWRRVLIILIAFGLVIVYQVVQINRSIRSANFIGCATNLRSLWQMQFNYAAQYGGPNQSLPTETGAAFWLTLQKTPKPMIEGYEPFF
ncbi:MAG TPA: hypothetical protein VK661_07085 [Planctomycetota bacterium]|nr:hypothetical protein [Planctomycetota bacterium]